jgi:hypothetical protein
MASHPLFGLFYVVQFDENPSFAIERIAGKLIPSGMMGETAARLAEKIDAALASAESLEPLNLSDSHFSDEELRVFLHALRERLSAA